ncbi:hypothetical protein GGR52DRAFT_550489 [Hypoxylon sp. FL1284]|nr:hypothetical protein GGR52DRAFT_550489 [Hypoxylon sp. FL1284]
MTSQQQPSRPLREVKPDILSIDGHQFHINYGVPQHITDRLLGLLDEDERVRYEDIPDDLKEYEILPSSQETEASERRSGPSAANSSGGT